MKNLSYTQEYFLCAVNAKGGLKTDAIYASLFASAVFELLSGGYIKYVGDNKEWIAADRPLDHSLSYLKPLYDFIANQKEPLEAMSLPGFLTNSKLFQELISAVGSSLAALDCAEELPSQGLRKNRTRYAPKAEETKRVIEKIRAEFLEEGTVTDETFCLTALLYHSKIIKDYFSKVESEALKKRLDEVKNSGAFIATQEILETVMMAYVLRVTF